MFQSGIQFSFARRSGLAAIAFASILLAAFLAIETPGVASPGQTAINIRTNLPGDDDRYVAYLRPDETPVVFDSRSGKTRVITKAKGCAPVDVGGNRVLLNCFGPSFWEEEPVVPPRTASVRGGRSVPVPHSSKREEFTEIGRFWLRGDPLCPGACTPSTLYKSWRKGNEKAWGPPAHLDGPDRSTLDLNSRHLRPFDRPFEPKIRDGYISNFGICYTRTHVVTDYDNQLRLWRGPNDWTVIGRGGILSFDCAPYQGLRLGTEWVTWVRGKTIHAVNLRTLRKVKRTVERRGAAVVPVRGGIVLSEVTVAEKNQTRSRVRFIPLG